MPGYRHYADDVLEYFVQRTVTNGIDIIRILMHLTILRIFRLLLRLQRKREHTAQVALFPTQQVQYSHMIIM